MAPFEACVKAPFATLGISADDRHVTAIRYLSPDVPALAPKKNTLAHLVCVQLQAYLENPAFRFELPLKFGGTRHSPDHRLEAWSADLRGSEYFTIRVRAWATGQDLADNGRLL